MLDLPTLLSSTYLHYMSPGFDKLLLISSKITIDDLPFSSMGFSNLKLYSASTPERNLLKTALTEDPLLITRALVVRDPLLLSSLTSKTRFQDLQKVLLHRLYWGYHTTSLSSKPQEKRSTTDQESQSSRCYLASLTEQDILFINSLTSRDIIKLGAKCGAKFPPFAMEKATSTLKAKE